MKGRNYQNDFNTKTLRKDYASHYAARSKGGGTEIRINVQIRVIKLINMELTSYFRSVREAHLQALDKSNVHMSHMYSVLRVTES